MAKHKAPRPTAAVSSAKNKRVLAPKIPATFWDTLVPLYAGDDKPLAEKEKVLFRRLLPEVAARLAPRYTLDEALDKGGAGLICRLIDQELTRLQKDPARQKVHRALKMARPVETQQELLNNIITHEFTTLASLTHTNIIKLYGADHVTVDGTIRPFYVMDYIEGATKSWEYVSAESTSFHDLLRIIQQTTEALIFLFDNSIVHNDVKPSNVLVDRGRAILSDLGSAVSLREPDKTTTITFTAKYAHPNKKENAIVTREPNRMQRTLPSSDIQKTWDLFSLGLTILELLDLFAKHHPGQVPAYEYRYLRLLGSRLLDAKVSHVDAAFRAYAFPDEFYSATLYGNIHQILKDLQKITGQYALERAVPELAVFSERTVQVGMYGPTALTEKIQDLLKHPALKRLASISQLGLLVFLYPGATHTRAEHSLGVYANTARLIDALWHDPISPMFRQIMTAEDLLAGLLAALVHDVGQYPLAHDLEEARETFFGHEDLGREMAKRRIEGEESLLARIDRLWPVAPPIATKMSERVTKILDAKPGDTNFSPKDQILHSIFDGPIDADKLDYLMRDSLNLGVSYGRALDFERLSRVVTMVHEVKPGGLAVYLGAHERGKISAEVVAFARYAMYGSVYLHRTARAVKSMLHYGAWDMLKSSNEENLQSQFEDVIIRNRLPALQQQLFEKNKANQAMARALWPGFNLADQQMIAWLWQGCGDRGRMVLEALALGEIYERALVLGHDREEELWRNFNKFAMKASPADRLDLNDGVEEEISEFLGELTSTDREQTEAFHDERLAEIAVLRQKGPLVLVDIPVDRTSGMRDIKFFAETARWKYDEDDLVKIAVSKSDMWEAIVDKFHKSLGKVRVFVQPGAKRTLRAIPEFKWQGILKKGLNRANTSKARQGSTSEAEKGGATRLT
jgi:HD superfamily phosphohydrolase